MGVEQEKKKLSSLPQEAKCNNAIKIPASLSQEAPIVDRKKNRPWDQWKHHRIPKIQTLTH
jgi:hypothetical protein